MRNRIVVGSLILIANLVLAGAAMAWLAAPGGAISIAEARKLAESGDYFAIAGVVEESLGSRYFKVRDDTGEMTILIPEYLTRDNGPPLVGEKVHVAGKYDRKKLDHSIQGMRVSKLYRLGKVTGGRGEASPEAGTIVPPRSVPPAAALTEPGDQTSLTPNASRELVDRLRNARRQFEAASKEVDDAAEIYARAAYAAGPEGQVDPRVVQRLENAEASMAEVATIIPPLVAEARKAGVSDELITMYQQSLGSHR